MSDDQGSRRAWLMMLSTCLRNLGEDNPAIDKARLVVERQEAIAMLRVLCEQYGDNDWTSDLHLADIIEKHLGRHLGER